MSFNKTTKQQPSADWSELMDHVESKYGFKHRDMAGKYSKNASEEGKLWEKEWMAKNGYEGKEYVRHKPDGSNEDWPNDSPEMALRCEIHTKLYKDKKETFDKNYPYQDVWHWLIDNDFCGIHNGSYHYLTLAESRLNNLDEDYDVIPDYVVKVLKAVKAEVLENPAYNSESEDLYVWVDW